MRAWKYGSLYARRASSTATRLDASRLKNQTPGLPSAARTQVRTFSSRNSETSGSGRRPRARSPDSRNGAIPTQALPSNVSTSSSAGRSSRTSARETRQCANRSSSQVCPSTQPRLGTGQGRCSTCSSDRACRFAASSGPNIRWLVPSQVAAQGLLALDRLEQRLEVAVAEAAGAVPLDHLEEHRRPVLHRLREDLEQIAVVVAVGEDPVPAQVLVGLGDLPDPSGYLLVVRVGRFEEEGAAFLQCLDGLHDVARGERDVLCARAPVELDVLLDLALPL